MHPACRNEPGGRSLELPFCSHVNLRQASRWLRAFGMSNLILTASERGRIKMQHDRPDFPTMEQVEKANHEQLARWYRFLPSGDTKEQQKIMDRIAERFKRLGGMTPALERKIGF